MKKDRQDIEYGIEHDIDFIAASFVRKSQDVVEIRDFVQPLVKKYFGEEYPLPKIIAKIESIEGVDNFNEILKVSDGIMVARGDLGVEIPMTQLTNIQKLLIKKCNLMGKPVIVATQMLESMQLYPRPTRAEVADVTNAVHDGTDAVMLSGETAKGRYPVESVKTMNENINEAERWINIQGRQRQIIPEVGNFIESICYAAVESVESLKAECIIVISNNGNIARITSKFRPSVPILAYISSPKEGRLLILSKGVHPIISNLPKKTDLNILISDALNFAKKFGFCSAGKNVVLLSKEKSIKGMKNMYGLRMAHVD